VPIRGPEDEDRRRADVVSRAEHDQGEVADRIVARRLLPVANSHGRHRREPGLPSPRVGRAQPCGAPAVPIFCTSRDAIHFFSDSRLSPERSHEVNRERLAGHPC
jgi:hypothetical protein